MKKLICMLLVLVMLIGLLPLEAFAAEERFLEVTVENAPIRKKASSEGKIVARCPKGTVLRYAGSCINKKLNLWYEVQEYGKSNLYYIYSENVKFHEHSYRELEVNEVTYWICNCGYMEANADTKAEQKEAKKILAAATAALPLVDGPLPVGDVLAVGVVIVGTCLAQQLAVPAANQLANIISNVDFSDYLERRSNNNCSEYSFRRVQRIKGGLKYIDDKCMDQVEAYLYLRLVNGDVYTPNEDAAMLLAAMHKSAIMERDKAKPNKDISSYFFHYHLGVEREIGGHIFFGLNDLGQGPM